MPRRFLPCLSILVAGLGCGGGSAPSTVAPVAQGGCPSDGFCFNVFPGAPGPLGAVRLRVLWVRPDAEHDSSDIVEVGTLTGQERSFFVRRSTLRPPAKMGAYGVNWGYFFAVPANAGATSVKEAVGIAQMMFTHAMPEATSLPLSGPYPAGIAPGIAGYRMATVGGSGHDKFFLAPSGTVFDFVVCPIVQPKCNLPAPNPN